MKWQDGTSYSKSDKERIPRILEVNVRGLTIIIHRIIHYDEWHLTVRGKLNIKDLQLHTEDLEEAKIKGMEIVMNEILKLEKIRDVLVSNLR